jgi:hypothetical protein
LAEGLKKTKNIILGANRSKVELNPPLHKFSKPKNVRLENLLDKIKNLVIETKADKVMQPYSKRDYDVAYSAPYVVLNDPEAPSSLKDLAYRVVIVRTEEVAKKAANAEKDWNS